MSSPRVPFDPVVARYKQDVDLGLLEENLKRSPTERVRAMIDLYRVAEAVREAGRRATPPSK